MSSLKKQTVRGVKWLVGASFLQKALSVGTMVILARILNPSVFGLFALAFVAIDGLGLFKSMGFDSALIQRKDNIEKAANTAFFVIPGLGMLLFLMLNLLAPSIGTFLNSSDVVPVIRVLGLVFVFSCFSKVPISLLQKEMRFAKVAFSETIGSMAYSAIAIFLALSGFGIWSLVSGYLAKTLIVMVAVWYFAKWRPKFIFDKKIALEMFHFGKFLFLGSIIWFLKMNLGTLLVGKLFGVTMLGLYAIAFSISNFCVNQLGGKIYRVTYPAYSKLQDDLNRLKEAFLKVFKYTSMFALPFGIILFLLSKELLLLVYGEKWIGASSILKILSWSGLFNTLNVGILGLFIAYGKPKLDFAITSIQVIIFFIFISPMAKILGMNGVGLVVSLSSVIGFFFALIWVMRLLQVKLSQIYYALKPSLISSLFMILGILFVKYILLLSQRGIVARYNFLILLLFSITLFVVSLSKIERPLVREMKEMVFK